MDHIQAFQYSKLQNCITECANYSTWLLCIRVSTNMQNTGMKQYLPTKPT